MRYYTTHVCQEKTLEDQTQSAFTRKRYDKKAFMCKIRSKYVLNIVFVILTPPYKLYLLKNTLRVGEYLLSRGASPETLFWPTCTRPTITIDYNSVKLVLNSKFQNLSICLTKANK